MLRDKIKEVANWISSLPKNKSLKIISHFDTDGITSAAIFSKALQRAGIKFSLEIVRNLESSFIENLGEDAPIIFLDLASGSLPQLSSKNTRIVILDHHEISSEIPENVVMINPTLYENERIASSGLCYLFAKELSQQNIDLANLAVVGMIGDMMEKEIGKTYDEILKDASVIVKKGILLYPATRPLDRVLENSFSLYIPEVTGSYKGVIGLLREAGIQKTERGYKTIAELTDEEMSRLGTAIMLKNISSSDMSNLIGNIYLVKLFNNLEDAREISATINACSRLDRHETALGMCLGNKEMKKEAERVYSKYKKTISSALETVQETTKISGKNYTIINARDKIKDTIIGTIASIMSFSPVYPEGTIIIAMSYTQDSNKIKVSARLAGRKGRNVREILHKAVVPMSAEVGGHPNAAGCLLPKENEEQFIENLKQTLELEIIKV